MTTKTAIEGMIREVVDQDNYDGLCDFDLYAEEVIQKIVALIDEALSPTEEQRSKLQQVAGHILAEFQSERAYEEEEEEEEEE